MKKFRVILASLLVLAAGVNVASAQSLSDILGKIGSAVGKSSSSDKGSGSNLGGTLGNLLEGVFSSSNISVADMRGNWISSGPAVCFQGDDLLKKAGGMAAAAAIESKLEPYFKTYGLTGATLSIDETGNFTLKIKAITLKGNITPNAGGEKGVFDFNFTALGKMKLGSIKTYVQKSYNSMDVMFDAQKLMTLISTVAKVSNVSTLKTLSSLLNSYDGLCVGFKMSAQ